MEEETRENKSPIRNRYKLYKFLTVALFLVVVFFSIGAITVETTSTSKFCSTCHEMQPEYYTWKASSHSEVDCVQCHIKSGVDEYAKAKANGLVEVYKKTTGKYIAPIRMPDEVPDESCEKCHNVYKRNFTTSGDIIISHVKHKENDVTCVQCHSGIAHGNIADRKMTFQSDYANWDSTIGKTAMSEMKFVKPDMDTCMDCHKARDVTTECSACHTTGMVPDNHKKEDFVKETHGDEAEANLAECNDCHKDMSITKLEGYEEQSLVSKYLSQNPQTQKKTHIQYAKENTYCVDCHNKRPASHTPDLISNHGDYANQDKASCAVCHENDRSIKSSQNKVNCSSCHVRSPKNHPNNWRNGHPVDVSGNQKPQQSCYTCHVEKNCSKCHK